MNTKQRNKLTPQQLLFCKLYTTIGKTFANATLSYAEAYGYDLENMSREREKDDKGFDIAGTSEYDRAYRTCSANGSRLLNNDDIFEEKTRLLVEQFENDKIIDARLQEIVISGKDSDSIQAIKHRNDLKQRITKKVDITTAGRPLAGLSDDELKALAED